MYDINKKRLVLNYRGVDKAFYIVADSADAMDALSDIADDLGMEMPCTPSYSELPYFCFMMIVAVSGRIITRKWRS